MKIRLGAAPHANEATVKIATQDIRNRLRPNLSENQFDAGRMIAFATRYDVSTHVASSVVAESDPAIYGSATAAIDVSSTSMNVASITAAAISQGFTPASTTADSSGGAVAASAMLSKLAPFQNLRFREISAGRGCFF